MVDESPDESVPLTELASIGNYERHVVGEGPCLHVVTPFKIACFNS